MAPTSSARSRTATRNSSSRSRSSSGTPHTQTHLDVVGADAYPTFLGGAGWPEFVDFTGGDGVPIHVEIEYSNGNLQVHIAAPATTGPRGEAEPAFPRTKVLDTAVTFATVGGLPVPPGEEPVLGTAWLGFTAGTGGGIFQGAVDDLVIRTYPGSPLQSFRRGDSDANGQIDLTDAVRIRPPVSRPASGYLGGRRNARRSPGRRPRRARRRSR